MVRLGRIGWLWLPMVCAGGQIGSRLADSLEQVQDPGEPEPEPGATWRSAHFWSVQVLHGDIWFHNWQHRLSSDLALPRSCGGCQEEEEILFPRQYPPACIPLQSVHCPLSALGNFSVQSWTPLQWRRTHVVIPCSCMVNHLAVSWGVVGMCARGLPSTRSQYTLNIQGVTDSEPLCWFIIRTMQQTKDRSSTRHSALWHLCQILSIYANIYSFAWLLVPQTGAYRDFHTHTHTHPSIHF